jgi:colanic acid biosynthesis glycosyl transferase WcaI
LYRGIGAVVRVLYRSADLVVPVTDAFIPTIREYAPDAQMAVIENGVDLDRFQPPANRAELRRKLGVDKRFVVSYIGTIGMAHGLEMLLDAAGLLKARFADALVLVAGEGAERERIERLAAERQLTNIKFLGQRPRSEIADLVGASDACLVLLRNSEVFKTVLPSKMLEFMACGTPTVVSVDGFARRLVTESNSGVYVPNGDAVALTAAIMDLSRDPGARAWLGGNGREFVRRRFSRRSKAVEYLRALDSIPVLNPTYVRTAPRALRRALQTGTAQQQG